MDRSTVLVAWCQLRKVTRVFRLDRIDHHRSKFSPQPGAGAGCSVASVPGGRGHIGKGPQIRRRRGRNAFANKGSALICRRAEKQDQKNACLG
ncbi:WYL domain-containing protein [Arenibacterium sp. CAU 1754]